MRVLEKTLAARSAGRPTFLFEFFVPKTSQGVQNLYDRIDRMYDLLPQFVDITWNAGGRALDLTNDMVDVCSSVLGLDTCMHLTCTNMAVEVIDTALDRAREAGCQTILALRGDPPIDGSDSTGTFLYAKDLIRHIRNRHGDYFDIGVAAYPEGHPEESDPAKLIDFLQEKVDAGANFVITQMFYDADIFIEWCAAVRARGIDIPIFPGIMPISTYALFVRRAKWCEIKVPAAFMAALEPIKDNDAAVREKGTQLVADLCQKLFDSGYIHHLHIYTMNLEKLCVMLLERLGLGSSREGTPDPAGALPWRKLLKPARTAEAIRPIFWANRKHLYVKRTAEWDEFPNGRWGDLRSPAFGDIDLHSGQLLMRQTSSKALELWGLPQNTDDLARVFVDYLSGAIPSFPWSDGAVTDEAAIIRPQLTELNRRGVFTINSQPAVNGAPSNNLVFGWGPASGFVYQKQYLEFFIAKTAVEPLVEKASKANADAGYTVVSYYAVDVDGNLTTNARENEIHAVTWGIFPGQEVVQPTIVERTSFLAWKDEAFQIVQAWADALKTERSKANAEASLERFDTAIALLERFPQEYVLCNVVDHEYMGGNDRVFRLVELSL